MKYDIFISYRREGGFETAKHLFDLLTIDGYKVSFDIDTLRNGDFDTQLYSIIDSCTDFILILDAKAFERTLDPTFPEKNDWMRNELAYALRRDKNIIPIMLKDFTFPESLPDDIAGVKMKNAPAYTKDYFSNFYANLKSFLNSKPRRRYITYAKISAVIISFIALLLVAINQYPFSLPSSPDDISLADELAIDGDLKRQFNKEQFVKMYNQELAAYNKKQLPEWVFEAQGDGRYIGVSDPEMEPEMAFEQALLRAWMLSQIDNNAEAEVFIELIYSEGKDNLTRRVKLLSSSMKSVTLLARQQYISQYGEYFIEFVVDSSSKEDSYKFNVNSYSKIIIDLFTDNNSRSLSSLISFPSYNDDYILYREDDNAENHYTYRDTFQFTPTLSEKGDKEYIPLYSSNGVEISPSSTENGYWVSFVNSLLQALLPYTLNNNPEELTEESYGDLDEAISSNMQHNTTRFVMLEFNAKVKSVKMNSDNLYCDWDIELK